MTSRDTAFAELVLPWYRKHHRRLPWRTTTTPYRIWISEIMLQQTTVQAVIPYYEKWIKRFPNIRSLGETSLQEVLKAWEGLGYYQRAKNIHSAARIFRDEFKGKIPDEYDVLIKIPGFGPYTTAAVLSIAYDKPHPVIDANVRRVWMRLMGIRLQASPQVDTTIKKFMEPFLPQTKIGLFNQAMMELGALICRSKNPMCLLCPVLDFCQAFENGEQEIIPLPRKRSYRKIEAVIGLVNIQGKYLIQKRPPEGLLADLWEFPGGKREPGETLEEALSREIKEELSAEMVSAEFLTNVKHAYTQFQVTLHAFSCTLKGLPPLPKDKYRWVSLKAMKHYPFPSGSAKIIRFLENQ
ncbi:A/G-specific adenine glycosylase [Acidobacteriota bacterium]